MSSNAIDYNEMNNSNITNPFSNNKRKTNLRTIFHQKDILIKYASKIPGNTINKIKKVFD